MNSACVKWFRRRYLCMSNFPEYERGPEGGMTTGSGALQLHYSTTDTSDGEQQGFVTLRYKTVLNIEQCRQATDQSLLIG